MPLRDHFRPPTTKYGSWESLHGGWPMVIIQRMRKQLPPGFVAAPRVHLGPYFEIDIAAFESDERPSDFGERTSGRAATATLASLRPTWAIETDAPQEDVYEVEIYNTEEERLLVAVIEMVSPATKNRPEKRRAFVARCGALLRKGVAVSLVDLVTIRPANLYAELMAFIGHPDPTLGPEPPSIYVSSCRWTTNPEGTRAHLEAWSSPLVVGQPLPSLPIWLPDSQSLLFDLEGSYEQTCEDLSIR